MYLIETDLLYTLASPGTARHGTSYGLFQAAAQGRIELQVSSLSFLEFLVSVNSGKVKLSVPADVFFERLARRIREFGIKEAPVLLEDTAESIQLREKYGLTFFDAYYAAQAKRLQAYLLSYDKDYRRVQEIRCVNPDRALSML